MRSHRACDAFLAPSSPPHILAIRHPLALPHRARTLPLALLPTPTNRTKIEVGTQAARAEHTAAVFENWRVLPTSVGAARTQLAPAPRACRKKTDECQCGQVGGKESLAGVSQLIVRPRRRDSCRSRRPLPTGAITARQGTARASAITEFSPLPWAWPCCWYCFCCCRRSYSRCCSR